MLLYSIREMYTAFLILHSELYYFAFLLKVVVMLTLREQGKGRKLLDL